MTDDPDNVIDFGKASQAGGRTNNGALVNGFSIRAATAADHPFLREVLWLAFRWRDPEPPPVPDSLPHEVAKYVLDFPRRSDHGVVATNEAGCPAGAAWYRLLTPAEPGYGFVDAEAPEITIAVRPEFRGRGIGSSLLQQLLADAKAQGLTRVSLSTEPDNPALGMYLRAGFRRVGECGGSWTMVGDCAPGGASPHEHP